MLLVYPGLTEKQKKDMRNVFKRTRRAPDGFEYPRGRVDYYPKKKDGPAELARKENRREKYREMRIAEVESKIEDADAVREVGGVVFKKDVPKEVDLDALGDGEAAKLRSWVKMGILNAYDATGDESAEHGIDLSDLKVAQLRRRADGLEINTKKLNKAELIAAIRKAEADIEATETHGDDEDEGE